MASIGAMIIDVWETDTFDEELTRKLAGAKSLVGEYLTKDRDITNSYDLATGRYRPPMRPNNPYAGAFQALTEEVGELMNTRTIRAWHYTRLTDDEVMATRTQGIRLSSIESLRARLDARVAAGDFSAWQKDALFAASPLHDAEQLASRENRFWMTSHPIVADDSGVKLLLK